MPRPPAPEATPARPAGPPMGLIAAVVVLVVSLIGGLVLWAVTRDSDLQAEGSSSVLPEGEGVSVGPGADADVLQVRVYEDFQCPWCGRLEAAVGEELTERAEAGELNVTYTIMSFLDSGLGNDSSTRAANAALCADDQDAFVPFHGAVFAAQPAEEGTGWTDDELLGLAEEAGLAGGDLDTFGSCLSEDRYGDYVAAMQERANRDGISGTPTVTIDGEELTSEEMQALLDGTSTLDDVLAAHS